jgi:hypothetical protein
MLRYCLRSRGFYRDADSGWRALTTLLLGYEMLFGGLYEIINFITTVNKKGFAVALQRMESACRRFADKRAVFRLRF